MTETHEQKLANKRLRILVVEDHDLLREALLEAFSGMHIVYTASSVKEGWKLYLETTPSIVFLDIGLPDGDGHDLARRFKEQNPATYIVMTTASRHIEDKKEAVHNHVDGYISKPFSKREINDYVDRYITASCKTACKQ
jgi:two-component system, chemotaxis family, chemotaxis protein CheY